jgi:hypothetical protein
MANKHYVKKRQIVATVQLSDGSALEGQLFIESGSRVLDLLNGEHTFIPILAEDGSIQLLNKFEVVRVIPHEQKQRDR